MRLFRIGRYWYADIRIGGDRLKRSTRCTDKKAAETVARQWERDAADPDHAATAQATLGQALAMLITEREQQVGAGRRSLGTVSCYRTKAGHWTRLFESTEAGAYSPFALAGLHAREVDLFISMRRREGVGDSTIAKELVVLRAALKLAKRRGLWKGDVAAVCPIAFAPRYIPRSRSLTWPEAECLLAELSPDRSARVAFILATSACWSETEGALRADISPDHSQVLIRGTKRAARRRVVPIVTRRQQALLEHVIHHAAGEAPALFTPWKNVRRDLDEACLRIETRLNPGFDHEPVRGSRQSRAVPPRPFPTVSPNDLRRTFATWLRSDGVPPHLIAPLMGHADGRMVERVYGRLPLDELAARVASVLPAVSRIVTQEQDLMGTNGGNAPAGDDSELLLAET